MRDVKIAEIVKELDLEVIWGNEFLDRRIKKNMSSRPSVEIYTGYFDYFEADRVQVIGTKESELFKLLKPDEKKARVESLFDYNSPTYIFTKNVKIPKEFVEAAIKKQMPLLKSYLTTSVLISNLTNILSSKLADRKSIDGAMMDIYGVGVLIQGQSGIGKSETALELIKRGHLLIADDVTKVYQREPGMLLAETDKMTERLMDIKDIGMVNVINLFGIGSFRHKKRLMLVIELVKSEEELGKEEYATFFDTQVPKIKILVASNRNIASLIETAALNNRLKIMGQNGDEEYALRLANTVIKRGK